jgi:hypothetical protein
MECGDSSPLSFSVGAQSRKRLLRADARQKNCHTPIILRLKVCHGLFYKQKYTISNSCHSSDHGAALHLTIDRLPFNT